MRDSRRSFRRPPTDRRGVTLVLVAVMSTALVSLGAFVMNWSYIELTNTQLRSASDAAAKAAVVTLSETQSEDDARDKAQEIAAQYTVGGRSLLLSDGDIEFGNSQPDGSGGYVYTPGGQPLNCARVDAGVGGKSATASIPVLFPHLLSPESFNLEKDAIAGRFDHDVCVVVDRSASMAWDLTGAEFSYPEEYNDDSTVQNYFRAPHEYGSRWAKLVEALEVFEEVIESRDLNAQIGMVSYASDYTFGDFVSYRVTTDQTLTDDTSKFVSAAVAIGQEPIIGDTDIAAGIESGSQVLTGDSARMTANRTMVLLSDGNATTGGDPVTYAGVAAESRITIHTVSFGDGADMDVMDAIAEGTGGTHYHAASAEELASAFETIAEELPAVLIQ